MNNIFKTLCDKSLCKTSDHSFDCLFHYNGIFNQINIAI